MKEVIFLAVFFGGVLAIGMFSSRNVRFRSWSWAGLVAVISIGDMSGINFVSREAYRGADRGFELTLSEMFALGLLFSQVLGYRPQRLLKGAKKNPPGFWLWALFILFAVVSLGGAMMPLYGWFSVWKYLRILFLFGTLWHAALIESDPEGFLAGLRRGFVLGLLVVGLMGTKQKFVDGLYRVPATFDHSNTVPLYVNLTAAPIMAWILGDKKISRQEFFLSFGAIGAALGAVLFTQSRLGILLGIAGTFSAVLVANFTLPSRRTKTATVVFVLSALVGSIMVMDTLMDRILNAPESSEQARHEFNEAAVLMAKDRFFGVGINNFSETMTRVERYREHVVVMADEEQAGVAHHLYLLTAAETGYLGLVVLLALFARFLFFNVAFFLNAPKYKLSEKFAFLRSVALAAAIGQIALHVSGFYEWAWRITPVTAQYFVLAGGLMGVLERASLAKDFQGGSA